MVLIETMHHFQRSPYCKKEGMTISAMVISSRPGTGPSTPFWVAMTWGWLYGIGFTWFYHISNHESNYYRLWSHCMWSYLGVLEPCRAQLVLVTALISKRLDVVGIWYTNIDPENHPFLVETHLPTPICQGLSWWRFSCYIPASLEIRSRALVYWQLLDRITRAACQALVSNCQSFTMFYESQLGRSGGFLKWGYPQIIHCCLGLSILNHPAIGVPPWLWKHPKWYSEKFTLPIPKFTSPTWLFIDSVVLFIC